MILLFILCEADFGWCCWVYFKGLFLHMMPAQNHLKWINQAMKNYFEVIYILHQGTRWSFYFFEMHDHFYLSKKMHYHFIIFKSILVMWLSGLNWAFFLAVILCVILSYQYLMDPGVGSQLWCVSWAQYSVMPWLLIWRTE